MSVGESAISTPLISGKMKNRQTVAERPARHHHGWATAGSWALPRRECGGAMAAPSLMALSLAVRALL